MPLCIWYSLVAPTIITEMNPKNLIRLFLILFVAGIAIGTHTSCSEDSDCSIAGRAMINGTLYRMPAPSETILQNDTLDSLTVTALGTDSIIINNQKKVHTLSLPLRFTSDSTVFIFYYAYREDPTLCDHAVELRYFIGAILQVGIHGDDNIPFRLFESAV